MKKTVITEDFATADRTQAKTDHDTLIRVETKLDQVMSQALPSLASDIKDLREGLMARIVVLETWKEKEDSYHAAIPLSVYDDNSKWVSDYRANLKYEEARKMRLNAFYILVATLFSSALTIVLQKLVHF